MRLVHDPEHNFAVGGVLGGDIGPQLSKNLIARTALSDDCSTCLLISLKALSLR